MDCLKSIDYLKNENVKIDCFVSLNEGLYEGGGCYAINSDMFLGYAMPLFKEQYIHIMNKNYYSRMYRVSMDLPYAMERISEDDNRYISPLIFSEESYHVGHAKVYQMNRLNTSNKVLHINSDITFKIIHDSIWNYYEELDVCIISFSQQGQASFFDNKTKILDLNTNTIDAIFDYCVKNNVERIGFTPFGRGNYQQFINKIIGLGSRYPKEIFMFHLNKNDYHNITA